MAKAKTSQKHECLKLLGQGHLSQKQIAQKLNIRVETISRWKRDPEFLVAIQMLRRDPAVALKLPKLTSEDIQKAAAGILVNEIDMVLLQKIKSGEVKLENLRAEMLLEFRRIFIDYGEPDNE